MNVNDPIAPRALAASHPDASPSEVDWQAWQLRYADMDRAVVARIGGNEYRRRAFASFDPIRCRYQDCGEAHPLALPDEQVTCPVCREDQGLPPLTRTEDRATAD
jgi:hypothetical protein